MFRRTQIGFLIVLIIISCNCLFGISEDTDITKSPGNVVQQKMLADLEEMKSLMQNINRRFMDNINNINDTIKELPVFDVRFDPIPEKCKTKDLPINCDQATACIKRNGIYKIVVEKFSKDPFLVECDAKTLNGGWLLIQRRHDGSENFYRDWIFYKDGFGNIQSEFFIGLDKLHALTNYLGPQELLVVIEEVGVYKYARYSSFAIGNEEELYKLKSLGQYSGTAGDSLESHINMEFTTRDRDHDKDVSNCAQRYTGAWWYDKCHLSNLNGKYGDISFGKGINWHTYKGSNHSIVNVKMMIRRRRE
ncbi:ficolin-1-like [Haematobia irritans]|uniref:ficolin-1-like n=1 Tax=Haematobia irritans TaxID=7368 RepID=UPI003F500E40